MKLQEGPASPAGNLGPSKFLTRNQKKKRRQRLTKHYRTSGTSTDVSEGSSLASCSAHCRSNSTEIGNTACSDSQASVGTAIRQGHAPGTQYFTAAAPFAEKSSEAQTQAPGQAHREPEAVAQAGEAAAQQDFSTAARCISLALDEVHPAATPLVSARTSTTRQQFRHGNYRSYYGYRLESLGEDPRVQIFQKQWFHNKRCLDIGCNAGFVSMAVAARFACASMLGVDIDKQLIQQACRNLAEQRTKARAQYAALGRQTSQAIPAASDQSPSAQRKAARAAATSLAHVWFQQEDFVAAEHEPGSMDAVLCLSVTKWVHLNGGDPALQRLFAAVHRVLTPGGHFILEAQPWRSYKQALRKVNKVSEGMVPLAELELRPDGFCAYLTDVLSFIFLHELVVPQSSTGFDRPIWVLQRGWQ